MSARLIKIFTNRRCGFWPALAAFLALASTRAPAQATIVYGRFPVTPEQPPGTFTFPQDSEGWRLFGDTTWPANYDFLINGQLAYAFTAARGVYVTPSSSLNAIMAIPVGAFGDGFAVPLAAGQQIGPDAGGLNWISDWNGGSTLTYSYDGGAGGLEHSGLFTGVESAYLGLQFRQNGKTYYGWARVGTPYPGLNIGWLFDYAYQTTPNTPIRAGAKPVIAPQASPEIVRAGYLRLRWLSELGKAYQVQFKERLDATLWTNLDFVLPAVATNSTVDVPIVGNARFYRVVEAE